MCIRDSNTWMHTGMLLVDGEKMSKSLGNFFTLAEVLEQHSAAALRLLMLQTSYRSPLDFSWERLEGAENSLTRIAGTVENLRWAANHATADADEAASEAFAAKAAEMATSMCGMDTLVFTAGIGEHAPAVRAGVADRLAFMGVKMDHARNALRGDGAWCLSAKDSKVKIFVIPTDEEFMIASDVERIVSGK